MPTKRELTDKEVFGPTNTATAQRELTDEEVFGNAKPDNTRGFSAPADEVVSSPGFTAPPDEVVSSPGSGFSAPAEDIAEAQKGFSLPDEATKETGFSLPPEAVEAAKPSFSLPAEARKGFTAPASDVAATSKRFIAPEDDVKATSEAMPPMATDSLQPAGSPFSQTGLGGQRGFGYGERLNDRGEIMPNAIGGKPMTTEAWSALPEAVRDELFKDTPEHRAYMQELGTHLANAQAWEAGAEAVTWSPFKYLKLPIHEGESAPMTYGKEAANVLIGLPEFLTSPAGIALGASGAAAPRLFASLFTADMVHSLGEQVQHNYKNWDNMTDTQKRVAITDMIGTGAFAALSGKHAFSGGPVSGRLEPNSEQAAIMGGTPLERTIADPQVERLKANNAPATADALQETITATADAAPTATTEVTPPADQPATPEANPVEQKRMSPVQAGEASMHLGEIQTVAELRELRQKWEESPDDDRQQHMLELINERVNQLQNDRGRSLNATFSTESESNAGGQSTEATPAGNGSPAPSLANRIRGFKVPVEEMAPEAAPEPVAPDPESVAQTPESVAPEAVNVSGSPEQPKSVADKIRSLKVDTKGQGLFSFSLPHPEAVKAIGAHAWNGALEIAANIVEAGGSIKNAIEAAIAHLRETSDGFSEANARANLDHVFGLTEQTPAPSGEPSQAAVEPQTYGVAARVSEKMAGEGRIEPVEPGQGTTATDSIQRGRKLLSDGANPDAIVDQFQKDNKVSADSMAVVRAHGETLSKAAKDAAAKFGVNSKESREAGQAMSDWQKKIKPMQTEWHKIGQAQQGETEVDTGTFHGLREAFIQATGKDFTPEQAKEAQRQADNVQQTTRQAEAARDAVMRQASTEAEKPNTSFPAHIMRAAESIVQTMEKRAEAATARLRMKLRSAGSGVDPTILKDVAEIGAAKLARKSMDFAEWSVEMANHLGDMAEKLKPYFDQAYRMSLDYDFETEGVVKLAKGEGDKVKRAIKDQADKGAGEKELQRQKAALENSIAGKQKQLETGDVEAKKKAVNRPANPALETLKQQRDELNRQLEEARKKPDDQKAADQLAKRVRDLNNQIADKQAKIDRGDTSTEPTRANRPMSPELEQARQKLDEMNKQLAEMRKKPAEQKTAEVLQRRIGQMQKDIAEKERKINSGDIAPKRGQVNRPLSSPELEKMRQRLDELNKKLADMRNPVKQPATIDEVRQQFKDYKPGSKFTPEQVKALWDAAKRFYLDKGVTSLDDIRHRLAADLGLSVEDVTKGLMQPKDAKRLTDAMYAKMSNQRRATDSAKRWLETQKNPKWMQAAKAVPNFLFAVKVFGHGTVGMITHAGSVMFNPTAIKPYWINFFRQYKLMGLHDGGAFHERMMQDLVRDPNYITARRAGLANDPTRYQDEYQTPAAVKFFKRIGLSGNRGFDALKLLRQARFNQAWDSLPESLKTPEMAKLIADAKNHESGIITGSFGKAGTALNLALFAPKLEASRWAFVYGDPAKAAKTFLNWKNATPEEQHAAVTELKQKASIAAMYFGALAFNQAMLSATGSDQSVNFTDPRRSDFLCFKVAGQDVGIIKPLTGTIQLLAKLTHDALGDRSGFERTRSRYEQAGIDIWDYTRGKLSPFAGPAMDLTFQADYRGRPMPFSNDPVPRNLRRMGITEPYGYGEYAAKTLLPIPASQALTEVWEREGMDESQRHLWLSALLKAGVMGLTGAHVKHDYQADNGQ